MKEWLQKKNVIFSLSDMKDQIWKIVSCNLPEKVYHLRPYSPTPVNVNCRLKYFVTLVTYCYNNVFVYFNLQLTLTGVGEYGS
jgi:hypothetical protein